MTDLLLDNFKLVVLFVWIAAVIALPHLGQAAPPPHKSRRRSRVSATAGR